MSSTDFCRCGFATWPTALPFCSGPTMRPSCEKPHTAFGCTVRTVSRSALVAAQQCGQQDAPTGFLIVQVEVAEVEQRFRAPDLAEIDQAGVPVTGAEYRRHVEVAVLQNCGGAAADKLVLDKVFDGLEAGAVEEGCQRTRPWPWEERGQERLGRCRRPSLRGRADDGAIPLPLRGSHRPLPRCADRTRLDHAKFDRPESRPRPAYVERSLPRRCRRPGGAVRRRRPCRRRPCGTTVTSSRR